MQEIEAYLHNGESRLTFVRLGMCAYTFELPSFIDKTGQDSKAKLLFYFEKSGV